MGTPTSARQASPPQRPTNQSMVRKDVPAVRHTISILEHLKARKAPATMSEIGNALGMNPSTCFNILKTLEGAGLLAFDASTKTYRLGFGLIELAASVDGHAEIMRVVRESVEQLAQELELTVVVVRMNGNGEFVVVDRVESPKPVKVTLAIGERFPVNAPIMAKTYFSWADEEAVNDMIARHGLPQYTPNSITDPDTFKDQLRLTRKKGFATSLGEYYPQKITLGSPVFDSEARVTHLIVVLALGFELPPEVIPKYGLRLVATAREVTRKVGGSWPRSTSKTF